MNYIIVTSENGMKTSDNIRRLTNKHFILIDKKELNLKKVGIQLEIYIFPTLVIYVPEEIYNNFECVIFHMTDVPFAGGSPLQNLITRGVMPNEISARQ